MDVDGLLFYTCTPGSRAARVDKRRDEGNQVANIRKREGTYGIALNGTVHRQVTT
jgi:hypothetical protein